MDAFCTRLDAQRRAPDSDSRREALALSRRCGDAARRCVHTPAVHAAGQRQGVARSAAIFVFDGEPLAANMAPKDYEMEDGDIIDVVTPGHPEYAQQLARLTALGLADGPPDQAGASIFAQAVAAGEQAALEWRDRRAAEEARAGSASDTRRQRNPRSRRAGSSSRSSRSR